MKHPSRLLEVTRIFFVAATLALCAAVAANPTAVSAAECKMLQAADLPVRLQRNKLIVDGEINGHKVGIVLDTGSTRTLILRSAAERLGLRRDQARGVRMFGVGGETNVESALVDEIRIGEAGRKNLRMLVAGEHELGRDMDVLLGEDFLHGYDIEFDLAHGAVRLYQPRGCEGVPLAYWATDGASEVAIDAIDEVRPQIRFSVLVNGHPLSALLDSGAAISLLDSPVAARLGVTPATPGVTPLGRGGGLGQKAIDYWTGPFQSFAIGDETIRDTSIAFAALFKDASYTMTGSHVPRKVESVAMLLGADFLRAHRVLVAHSQQKMYFTYIGGPVFQHLAPAASSGETRREADAGPAGGDK